MTVGRGLTWIGVSITIISMIITLLFKPNRFNGVCWQLALGSPLRSAGTAPVDQQERLVMMVMMMMMILLVKMGDGGDDDVMMM